MHDQQTVSSSQGREPEAMHSHDYKVEVRIRSRAASCFFVVMDVEEISEKGTATPPSSCLSFPIIRSTWMAQVNHRMATFSTLESVETLATPPSCGGGGCERAGGPRKCKPASSNQGAGIRAVTPYGLPYILPYSYQILNSSGIAAQTNTVDRELVDGSRTHSSLSIYRQAALSNPTAN
jgi:hypothetical protein